MSLHEIVKLMF